MTCSLEFRDSFLETLSVRVSGAGIDVSSSRRCDPVLRKGGREGDLLSSASSLRNRISERFTGSTRAPVVASLGKPDRTARVAKPVIVLDV